MIAQQIKREIKPSGYKMYIRHVARAIQHPDRFECRLYVKTGRLDVNMSLREAL